MFLGLCAAFLIGSDCNETSFIMGLLSSPHTTSYAIVLIEVLAPIFEQFNYVPTNGIIVSARDRGLMYIIMNTIIQNLWRWSVTFK